MNILRLCKNAAAAAGLSIALMHAPANAAVDFNTNVNPIANGTTVLSGGYSFSSPSYIGVMNSDSLGLPQSSSVANNHTPMLVFSNTGQVTVTQTGGGLFSLGSLDAGGWLNGPIAGGLQLNIVGHNTVAGDQFASLSLPPSSFAHITLSPLFTNLTSLTLSVTGYTSFAFAAADNLTLAPVPEPETYALLLAGLGLLAAAARRRKVRRS